MARRRFLDAYHSLYKNPIEELERVFNSELRDIETAKKMIKLLVAYSKEEIPLTKENEDLSDYNISLQNGVISIY